MLLIFRRLAACLGLAVVVAGCSTPGKRAREHAAAFQRLSTPDRKLVLHGHVRIGLSQEAVRIAWGEPDEKIVGAKAGEKDVPNERWIYRHRVTLLEAMNSYDYFGPSHGYGIWPTERWLHPGYGAGGIGNEGVLQYQPHLRNLDIVRIAEFQDGQIDRYKATRSAWIVRAGVVRSLTADTLNVRPTHTLAHRPNRFASTHVVQHAKRGGKTHRLTVAARRSHQGAKSHRKLLSILRAQRHGRPISESISKK